MQNEPGTLRFEVIRDENNRNRFYLDEVYEDEAAFLQHCRNETIARFYELIDSYAFGPLFPVQGLPRRRLILAPAARRRTPRRISMRILHSMLRVADLEAALEFYTRALDMRLLRRRDYPEGRFTLAFVGYQDERAAAALS